MKKMTLEEQKRLIDIDVTLIKKIKDPAKEVIELATMNNPKVILSLKQPTLAQFQRIVRWHPEWATKFTQSQIPEDYLLTTLKDRRLQSNLAENLPYHTEDIDCYLIEARCIPVEEIDLQNERVLEAYIQAYPEEVNKHPHPTIEFYQRYLARQAERIRHIENPTREVQMLLLELSNHHLQDSTFQALHPEVKEQLIGKNGAFLRYLKQKERTEKLARIALNSELPNGEAIKYIGNPTEEEQMKAIKCGIWSIQYIENPTEKVQLMTLSLNKTSMECILDPSEKAMEYFFKGSRVDSFKHLSLPKKVQLRAVERKISAVKYLHGIDPEVEIKALEISPEAWEMKRYWSEEAALFAMKTYPWLVKKEEWEKFPHYICKLYRAMQKEEGYQEHMLHFIHEYIEEKEDEMDLADFPIISFEVLVEAICQLPDGKEKRNLMITIEKNKKTAEQEQFWKQVKEFYR